ncbi:hypothetical protein I79_023654 [Cricetulus griseus]|uniref:Uncharacterized protein n=1 Tax=Cricetulus griseus TaxID=10029 RepID=G3III3_CRIGR|nr:hypothetical protein I79_023654 [Cricetulus griseus]
MRQLFSLGSQHDWTEHWRIDYLAEMPLTDFEGKSQYHALLPLNFPSTGQQTKGTGNILTSIISKWTKTNRRQPGEGGIKTA